jgi:hypothetical protein
MAVALSIDGKDLVGWGYPKNANDAIVNIDGGLSKIAIASCAATSVPCMLYKDRAIPRRVFS